MAKKSNFPEGIRPSGAGYQIRIRAYGETYCETIKGKSKSSLAEAVKRREWLKARIVAGLPIRQGGESSIQVFEEVATDYLDTLEGRESTLREYYRILNGWWKPLFKKPIQDITTAEIKKILARMNVSGKTKKNRLIPLLGVFKHAEVKPPYIRLKREQRAEVSRYSPEEREALLSRLQGQAKVYFAILFGCGLRPGEALALQWPDYDGEILLISKAISKRRLTETKTSVRRKVYVPTWVRPILREHETRFKGGYIFQNSKGGPHLDSDVFNSEWRAAHDRQRIPYRIPYTCRHTRAAELLSVGVQPASAAKQLGHSAEMFLRVYSEFIDEYSTQDVSLLEGLGKKADKN